MLRKLLLGAVIATSASSGRAVAVAADRPLVLDTSPVPASGVASPLPEGWQHGAFIEIFVRGYKDSNGDGIGDLRGLIQSLDYLQALGIRGIWLMPVTRSQDHDHGYAVSDYRDIEPAYGSLADFDELVKQAHARGIGIIFDYVINHSAATNPIFVEASRAPDSRYRSWYVWRDRAPAGWNIMGKDPWVPTPTGAYLAQFSPSMPDFNFLEPEVMAFHKDNLRFWLNRGIDGFRFDAVTHLVENGPDAWHDQPGDYVLMGEVRALVDSYAHRYVVCEATKNAAGYASPSVCGSAFELDAGKRIVAAIHGDTKAVAELANYFSSASPTMATLISNHDLFAGERLWDQVHGNPRQYRLAAATYLLMPGTPFIYYGEEIGMSAAPGLRGDAKLRTPMSWTSDRGNAGFSAGKPYRVVAANVATQNVAAEQAALDSLLAFYKTLLALRNRYASIAAGSYERPFVDGLVMGYQRRLGEQSSLVVINYGKRSAQVTVPGLSAGAAFRQVLPEGGAAIAIGGDGTARLTMAAQSVRVFVR